MEELEMSAAWRRAVDGYLTELGTRDASPATVRAYRRDLHELAAWATARGSDPGRLAYRDLRGYAAELSGRGLAKSSIGRKLVAVRSFHRHLVDVGESRQNPADL